MRRFALCYARFGTPSFSARGSRYTWLERRRETVQLGHAAVVVVLASRSCHSGASDRDISEVAGKDEHNAKSGKGAHSSPSLETGKGGIVHPSTAAKVRSSPTEHTTFHEGDVETTFTSPSAGKVGRQLPVGARIQPVHMPNVLQSLFASWQQGVVASIGAVMGIGFLIFLFYAPVREDTVHHTAQVASEALGDVRLKERATQLSMDVVDDILNDPKSLDLVVRLLQKLVSREETKVAISSLLQSLFEDHYTQEVTKKFVLVIVRDPWIQDQLQVIAKDLVLRLLQNEEVKNALSEFLVSSASHSLQEPELHYVAARAVRKAVGNIFSL